MFEGEKGREGEREREGEKGRFDVESSQLSKRLLALIRKLS
jgi:hypothetical protein